MIRGFQIERAAALGTIDLHRRHAAFFHIAGGGRFQPQIAERDFPAGVKSLFAVAFIQRAEFSSAPGKIGKLDDFTRFECERDFPLAGNQRAFADFHDFHHPHFGNGNSVFHVQIGQARELRIPAATLARRLDSNALELPRANPTASRRETRRTIHPKLHLPSAEFAIGPLISKGTPLNLPRNPHFSGESVCTRIRNFAQVLKFSIRAAYHGTATRADGDHRIGDIKLNRRGTGGTGCLKTHKFALFPTTP